MEYETDMVAEKPSDLLKCDTLQLRLVCNEYNIIPDGDKWNLIGKLLHLFPASSVTDEDLHRFKSKELRSICDGLNISREGELEEIAERIEYYHNKILKQESFNQKKAKMKKLITQNFKNIVPSLPATVCNQYYRVTPYTSPIQDTYEWKKHITQEILIGDVPFKVNVHISISLEEDETPFGGPGPGDGDRGSGRKDEGSRKRKPTAHTREKRQREDEKEVQTKKKVKKEMGSFRT